MTLPDAITRWARLLPRETARVLPMALVLLTLAGAALAQSSLRNSFPGRRIGGGTRGECTARQLAHLVPASSIFAPGSSRTLGLLESPVATPRPLLLEFSPLSSSGSADRASKARISRELPPAGAGITLITLASPAATPLVWESSYRCGAEASAGADPLAFVDAVAPPAMSLLVSEVSAADQASQAALARLKAACGGTVPRQQVAEAFGLGDVITPDWPAQLPVRCF